MDAARGPGHERTDGSRCRDRAARAHGERGQVVLLVALLLVVSSAATLALAHLGAVATSGAHVRTAADAAALAGAVAGRSAAVELARANGAELVGWEQRGAVVVVTVDADGSRATAAAEAVVGGR